MSSIRILSRGASIGALCLGLCGCHGGEDYYARAYSACHYPVPGIGMFRDQEADRIRTTLTPECKAALEAILPYDSSFQAAPEGFKDKVTEAYQALLAYPLRLPDPDQLLHTRPSLAGPVPMALVDLFHEFDKPEQSAFNYVMNQVDVLTYNPTLDEGYSAQFMPTFDCSSLDGAYLNIGKRQITFTQRFWSKDDKSEFYVNPFFRASTLIHESRHSDGYLHTTCETEAVEGERCDSELNGPYGLQAVYLHYLIQGNPSTCSNYSECLWRIPNNTITDVAAKMVRILKRRINRLYPELRQKVEETDPTSITYVWLRQNEL